MTFFEHIVRTTAIVAIGISSWAMGGVVEAAETGAPGIEHDDHGSGEPVVQGTEGDACLSGVSSGYACNNVEMMSRLTLLDMGGGAGSDVWGWKDGETGRYYALMARSLGVSMVDVTDAENPVLVGNLPSDSSAQPWRDVKTYADHAFVVADNIAGHGMQVFDLTRLRGVTEFQNFAPDAVYREFGPAHNVVINADSGFAYAVGSNTCAGGLHMIDISNPKSPRNAGCYAGDGYTHDAQCVTYDGPDADYKGRELCFASNEDSMTIVDVTNKNSPFLVSKLNYPNVAYSHQGWLTEDHRFFLLSDELDEGGTGANARTVVLNVIDVDSPLYAGSHHGSSSTIDHNLYVRGPFVFQANYQAGLRILQIENPANARMREIGYFDTFPTGDNIGFNGAWSVYPFFDNGTILVSDINSGLFVLRADLPESEASPINGALSGAYVNDQLKDQGLLLFVGENDFGPFVFYTWFMYLDGQPFWVAGDTPFEYGVADIDIPTQRLEGLEFLTPGEATANRIEIGTLNLHKHHCNAVHVYYDFGELGSGDYHMNRLAGVQGRECNDVMK